MVQIRLLTDNVAGRVEIEARVNLETSGPSNLLLGRHETLIGDMRGNNVRSLIEQDSSDC